MSFLSRPLLINAAATLVAASTFAAETPAATVSEKIPAVTVSAPRANDAPTGSPTSPSLAEAKVALNTSTGAVNFITADDLAQGRAATLRDMLDYQPGVFIQSRTGQEEARLSIRGSGVQRTFHGRGILLLQDGLPLNLADGSFDMQNLDPAAYSRIGVWRGASAMTKGSGTLGGAVDFSSFTGHDAPTARLSAEGGSFGYGRVSGTLSTHGIAPADTADAVVTATYAHTDGWRDFSDSDSQRVNANIGTMLTKNTENRIYLAYTNTSTNLPGSLTLAQLNADPRQAAPGNITNPQERNYEWVRVADRVVSVFDDARIEISAGWQGKRLDHPIFQTLDVRTDDVFVQAKMDYTADLAGQKNRVTLGVTPSFGTVNDRRYVNPPGEAERGAKVGDFDDRAQNVAVFAEEDHYFTKSLAGTVGARFDYSAREHRVNQGVAADVRTKEYVGFSPSLGARYEFDDAKQQIFANVSRSFEAPTFGEFNTARSANPATLDAQTATTLEVGTRGEKGPVAWDAACYYAFVNDEFISNTVVPGLATTVNARDTRHRGVELGFDTNLLGGSVSDESAQRLVLRQVAGWNDFRFHNDATFGDNRIAGIPQTTYRVELTYFHPSGFYIGPNLEIASSSWVDHANTLSADGYAILGARVGYRKKTGFSCYLEGRNLLNKTYAATTGVVNTAPANAATTAAQFNPGDGFGAYAGVEYRW